MIGQFVQTTDLENFMILNDILELYRYIVEKYASANITVPNGQSNITVMCELAQFLDQTWDLQVANYKKYEDNTEMRERTLVL